MVLKKHFSTLLTFLVLVSANLSLFAPSPTHAQSPSTSFAYDYEGNLVWVKDTDGEHYYFGSEDVTVKQTGTVVGAVENKRFSVPITDSVSLVKDNDQLYLVSTDYLSSTRQIVRSDGTLVTSPSYHPYGEEKTDINLGSLPTDRFYTSQRKLAHTNLYHYGARLYSPTLGMFIQPDSVEGPNRYAYARNNPVMYSDPSGHVAALPNEGGDVSQQPTFTSSIQAVSSSTVINGTLSSSAPYERAEPQGDLTSLANVSILMATAGVGGVAVGPVASVLGEIGLGLGSACLGDPLLCQSIASIPLDIAAGNALAPGQSFGPLFANAGQAAFKQAQQAALIREEYQALGVEFRMVPREKMYSPKVAGYAYPWDYIFRNKSIAYIREDHWNNPRILLEEAGHTQQFRERSRLGLAWNEIWSPYQTKYNHEVEQQWHNASQLFNLGYKANTRLMTENLNYLFSNQMALRKAAQADRAHRITIGLGLGATGLSAAGTGIVLDALTR